MTQRKQPIGSLPVLGHQVQHMQKALEEMNVKLTEVASDVVGQTGLSIVKAIIKGERDAEKLAKLRDENCKRSETEIARALAGSWRDEHLFTLKQAVDAFYRRIAMRCGGPKAVIATARKIAERVYRLLKDGREYERRDAAAYEESYRKKVLKGLTRRASELGYRLEAVASSSA